MKIAIIGFGGMGNNHRKYIIPRLNDSDYPEKLDIAGIYDISEERKEFAAQLGLHNFNSAEEIFADESIKIVLIATPNDLHKPYVLDALSRGKNVIVEKPMGLDTDEVNEMYAAAKKYGKVFEVHQNRRWDDDFLTVKNMYDKKLLGETYLIESRVMGSNGIPGAWRKNPEQGGGMMLDWGVHLIDQMLLMIDDKVKSVECDYSYQAGEKVDDGFDLLVKFKGGMRYRIVVDTNTFIELPRWQENARAFLQSCKDAGVKVGDYLYLENIAENIASGEERFVAKVISGGRTRDIALETGALTREERKILLAGCLINFNKENAR